MILKRCDRCGFEGDDVMALVSLDVDLCEECAAEYDKLWGKLSGDLDGKLYAWVKEGKE